MEIKLGGLYRLDKASTHSAQHLLPLGIETFVETWVLCTL